MPEAEPVPNESVRNVRPFSVTVAALFLGLETSFFLLAFERSWRVLEKFPVPGKISDDELFRYVFVLLLPVLAAYHAVLAWGLWRLRAWARDWLMFVIVYCTLASGTSLSGLMFGKGIFWPSWDQKASTCVLIFDLFIYGCLAWYPDVAKAFGERDT